MTEIISDKLSTRLNYSRLDRGMGRLTGYIVAEAGDFKDGRGSFNMASLLKIVDCMNTVPGGVKSHFGHDDQLGKFLGRARNARIDGPRVRADLCFDKTAMDESILGGKPLGQYVMDLAESDPGALNSSLVLRSEKIPRVDPATGKKVFDAPPIWMPTEIFGSDIVTDGDATHGGLLKKISPDEDAQARLCARRHRLRLLKLKCL